MKIRFKLVKFEKVLAFQILEMDERFRSCSCENATEYQSKHFNIISGNNPELYTDEIYLRGDFLNADYKISTLDFKTNIERDEYHVKLLESLKDWSENWEGFREPKPVKSEDNQNDVYEF